MVFKENFVAVIMASGKILRENNGSVELPFGSDYSIQLKNLESRKAEVKVSIDGEDVLKDHSLILAPNSDMTLEGFMNGHTVRKKFRFIQKTEEIVKHRGDKLDDGIVRVEYCFEQRAAEHVPVYWDYQWHWVYPPYSPKQYPPQRFTYDRNTTDGWSDWQASNCTAGDPNKFTPTVISHSGYETSCDSANLSADVQVSFTATPNADEGITVPGADTYQHFGHGYIGATDAPHVITIRLRGTKSSGAAVEKPVGTKDKVKCPTCGRTWNTRYHFCPNCATNLGH